MRSQTSLTLLLVFITISVLSFPQPHPITSDWARNNPGIVGDTVYNSPAYEPRTSRTHRPTIRQEQYVLNNTSTDKDLVKPHRGVVLGVSIGGGILLMVVVSAGIIQCVKRGNRNSRVKAKSSA